MTTAPRTALARLTADDPGVVERCFGRRPLHLPAVDDGGFADLLSLDDVDHVVASTGLRAPGFRLVRDGVTLPTSAVTRDVRIGSRPVHDLVDVAAVHREFAAGASVVLQGLHRSWEPVATFCRALEADLTHPVQANAYLTPPVAQGLHLHEDPHDVFALQTHGVKRWVVHPGGDEEPWDLELRPGDVLYLPAGTRHAAQTTDRPSLHLTLGVRTVSWRDAVQRVTDQLLAEAAEDAELSTPLPAGWAHDPSALAASLHQRVLAVLRSPGASDADAALSGLADRFWDGRQPERAGGLRDVLELDDIDDLTRLRVRRDAVCRLRTEDGRLHVLLADRRLAMPVGLEAALRRLLELRTFAPKELGDHLDEPSRLVLCRRLVREGLLTIDRGTTHG